LVGNGADDRQPAQLALRAEIHSTFGRVSSFPRGGHPCPTELLDDSRRRYLHPSLVRHRARDRRFDPDGEAGRAIRRKVMSWQVFVLIPVALIAFVTGQLCLKRGMQFSAAKGFRDKKVLTFLGCGIFSMTINFLITLGLLAHLDLSFVYPFQGLSVIIVSLAAAAVLREKLNLRLTLGALLISVGVVLVSLS